MTFTALRIATARHASRSANKNTRCITPLTHCWANPRAPRHPSVATSHAPRLNADLAVAISIGTRAAGSDQRSTLQTDKSPPQKFEELSLRIHTPASTAKVDSLRTSASSFDADGIAVVEQSSEYVEMRNHFRKRQYNLHHLGEVDVNSAHPTLSTLNGLVRKHSVQRTCSLIDIRYVRATMSDHNLIFVQELYASVCIMCIV